MNIATYFNDVYKKGVVFCQGQEKLREFLDEPRTISLCLAKGKPVPVQSVSEAGPLVSQGSELYRVSTESQEIILLWNVQTADPVECAVRITIQVVVGDSSQLIDYWKDRLRALKNLDRTTVANEIISQLRDNVINEVSRYTFDELSAENALPDSWWRDEMVSRPFSAMGMTISSLAVSCSSPSIAEQKELEAITRSHELCIKKAQMSADYEEEMAAIAARLEAKQKELDFARHLSDSQRKTELVHAQIKADQEKTRLIQEAELARLKYEKERLELESDLADIRNRPKEKEAIAAEKQRSQEQFQQFSDMVTASLASLSNALGVITETLNKKATFSPELSLSMLYHVTGLSDSALSFLGHFETKEFYSRFFQSHKERTGREIELNLVKGISRDISSGQKTMRVQTLKVGESLAIHFRSPLSGYAIVMNLGTSGRFWLQSPNAYVMTEDARVIADERTSLPGPLLPQASLDRYHLFYEEGGPIGWEEVIVLVTSRPLSRFPGTVLPYSTREEPFVEIPSHAMKTLMNELSEFPDHEWCAGVLGFSVVQ